MQETIDEKDIISWAAGFFDAEGCFRVNRCIRKNNYITYSPRAIINNTDLSTMDYIIDLLLNKYKINAHIRDSKPTTNRNVIRYMEIGRITKIIDLCNLLLPYSIVKYDDIRLLKEFCLSRYNRFTDNNIKNNKLEYSSFEVGLYNKLIEYKAHKKGRKCLEFVPIYSNIPNNVSWSWLAGYTDGDGSFSINKRGTASYCLATSNPTAASKMEDFFNEKKLSFYSDSLLPSKNHLKTCKKRIFRYFLNDINDIINIIHNMKKYLISKSDAAALMLEYCELRKDRKGAWRTEYEKSFVSRMSKLTQ
jgi:hypothetical protein